MNRCVYTNNADFIEQNRALRNLLPFAENTGVLAQAFALKGKTAPNRLVCQAMEGCDGTATGEPGELTVRRYLRLARGGAGTIWLEATACEEQARANPRQLWLREDNVEAFRALAERIREEARKANGYEPLLILQDTHSGRYSKPHGRPEPLVAYNCPIFPKTAEEHILSDEELDRVRDHLVQNAVLAEKAGFDGVDIKACHRYLLSELLSAFTRENSRYGGCYENRTRLLREAVQGAVQSTGSSFLVTTRLNAYDGFCYPFGWGVSHTAACLDVDLAEPKLLLHQLQEDGASLVNITMGNPYFNPHVNRPFSKGGYVLKEHPLEGVARMLNGTAELQAEVPELPLVSSAMTYLGMAAPHVAAAYAEAGGFAFAGFGRMILANPDFAKQILRGELDPNRLCIACSKCTEIMRAGGTPGCVIRDREVYLPIYKTLIQGGK